MARQQFSHRSTPAANRVPPRTPIAPVVRAAVRFEPYMRDEKRAANTSKPPNGATNQTDTIDPKTP